MRKLYDAKQDERKNAARKRPGGEDPQQPSVKKFTVNVAGPNDDSQSRMDDLVVGLLASKCLPDSFATDPVFRSFVDGKH